MESLPVAMLRKANKVSCKATKALEIGDLKVFLNFKRIENLSAVAAHEEASQTKLHPHTVQADVSWPVTAEERQNGIEQENHKVVVRVQPEFNLPKASQDTKPIEWGLSHSAHLF